MYRSEYILGLIGSILATVSASLIFILSIVVGAILRLPALIDIKEFKFFGPVLRGTAGIAGMTALIAVIFSILIIVAAAVLGFIGTSKLRNDNKKGGILLVIAGGLLLFPPYLGSGIFGTAISVLFFIGGIIALTKKANPS